MIALTAGCCAHSRAAAYLASALRVTDQLVPSCASSTVVGSSLWAGAEFIPRLGEVLHMGEWLKRIFGSATPPLEGVPSEWVSELRSMLAEAYLIGGTNLSGSHLDSAMEAMVYGSGGSLNARPPSTQLIARGHSNKRVARELGIIPETVKSHAKHIFIKLGAQTRMDAEVVTLGLI